MKMLVKNRVCWKKFNSAALHSKELNFAGFRKSPFALFKGGLENFQGWVETRPTRKGFDRILPVFLDSRVKHGDRSSLPQWKPDQHNGASPMAGGAQVRPSMNYPVRCVKI
jgi:hypothetical protein